jgi:hypothetical protein
MIQWATLTQFYFAFSFKIEFYIIPLIKTGKISTAKNIDYLRPAPSLALRRGHMGAAKQMEVGNN